MFEKEDNELADYNARVAEREEQERAKEVEKEPEPRKAYEIRVSWDTSDFYYATDDMMDGFTRFAECIKQADGRQVQLIATQSGKVYAEYPVAA